MTLRLFAAAVILAIGLLITAKVYESQGNYKMYKMCHLFSTLSLLSLVFAGVGYILLMIGRVFV